MVLPISSRPFFWGAHVLGLTAITLVLIWTIRFRGGFDREDKDLSFNLHPICMLLGFVVVNGEAIMSWRASSWIYNEDIRTTNHLLSHLLASVFGIYGLIAVFKSQKERNIANFHSLHSWIGIGIFVLYGILFVYTGMVFLFPQLVTLTHENQGRIHGLLRFIGPSRTYEIVRVDHPFMPSAGPIVTNERGWIRRLLRSIGLINVTNERGRVRPSMPTARPNVQRQVRPFSLPGCRIFRKMRVWILRLLASMGLITLERRYMDWPGLSRRYLRTRPGANLTNEQELVQPFMPPARPIPTKEQGRMYGFLRFLIPAGSRICEDLHNPPRIRGFMRFFNPISGFNAMNNQKEQVAGRLCFYERSGDLNRRNEQGRLYGISRFFQPGGRLEPVNKELMIDSIESFYGTLELTPGWLPWHSVFGMVVYIVVVGNAALGFLQMLTILENSAGVPKYGSEAYLVNFAAISTILFGVFVIFTLLGDPLILIVQTSTELSHT